jgi:hypothetical protein
VDGITWFFHWVFHGFSSCLALHVDRVKSRPPLVGEVCAGAYRLRVVKHRLLTGKVIWVVNFDGLTTSNHRNHFPNNNPFFFGSQKNEEMQRGNHSTPGFRGGCALHLPPQKALLSWGCARFLIGSWRALNNWSTHSRFLMMYNMIWFKGFKMISFDLYLTVFALLIIVSHGLDDYNLFQYHLRWFKMNPATWLRGKIILQQRMEGPSLGYPFVAVWVAT